MTVTLLKIHPSDNRLMPSVPRGETVEDAVLLDVDGSAIWLQVFVQSRPIPGLQANVVGGEPRLEELLRFEPEALAELYALVGRTRVGDAVELPVTLVARPASWDWEPATASG